MSAAYPNRKRLGRLHNAQMDRCGKALANGALAGGGGGGGGAAPLSLFLREDESRRRSERWRRKPGAELLIESWRLGAVREG